MDDALTRLLERRVERDRSAPVDRATVDAWCAVFGSEWADHDDERVASVMFPMFVRPSEPPAPGRTMTGVVLHDELKQLLDLPVAIAVGYDLELVGELRIGDVLVPIERIAEVGDERTTRFGPGCDWVIEVSTSTIDGTVVGIERFRMLGYRPGSDGGSGERTPTEPVEPQWSETVEFDTESIVRCATANHVWAPAHHDAASARAAGLADIILDTSSHVALLAGAAQRRRPTSRITTVELAMKRPILPGASVTIGGVGDDASATVVASVDGREMSRATVTFDA